MKTKLWNWTIAMLLMLTTASSFAQAWERPYPNITTDLHYKAQQILPSSNGGFHVLLSQSAQSTSGSNFYMMEIDEDGNTLNVVSIGDGELHTAQHMITAANGDIVIVTFHTPGSPGTDSQIAFFRLDTDYNILEESVFGTSTFNESPRGIIETPGGDFWVTGLGASWPVNSFLQKINAQGQTIGAPVYDFNSNYYAIGIMARPGGGSRVLGYGSAQTTIHEFDDNGTLVNELFYTGDIVPSDFIETSDGGMAITARLSAGNVPLLIKTDANGAETWRNIYDTPGFLLLNGVVEKVDGTGYKLMFREQYPSTLQHSGLIETDLNGDWIWKKEYAINYFNEGLDLLALPDNGAIIAAERNISPYANSSYRTPYIIRTDANGNSFESAVSGTVGDDNNDDCVADGIDLSPGQLISAFQNDFSMYSTTIDPQGDYVLPAVEGSYKLAVFLPNSLWNSCEDSIDIVVPAADILEDQDFVISYIIEPLESISGYVFEDYDNDCMQDPFETTGYEGWTVFISLYENGNSLNLSTVTNSSGYYSFTNLTPFTSGAELFIYFEEPIGTGLNCGYPCWIEEFIAPIGETSFQFNNGVNCDTLPPFPIMSVSMGTDEIRPCTDESYNVQYCNIGGATAVDPYLEITIDPALSVTGSTPSWNSVQNNVYTFELDDLVSNECGTIEINFTSPCDDPLGTTYCSSVYAYPDTIGSPASPLWDQSEIQLTAECQSDSVKFIIKNIGTGDMQQTLDYIVIEDNVLLNDNSGDFQLDVNEELEVALLANGSFYRMQSEQAPGFPGLSTPISWIEGCGTSGPISLGMVNQYPLGDEDPWEDIFCLASSNSYDPNDKTGFPLGVSNEHYIDKNVALDYVIRFQNEGTADALIVEIRDELPVDLLKINTLRPGASSHPYTWDIAGNGEVIFTFENINLPPQSVDEEASKGYVQFKIQQQVDLPIGTVIENSAAIYFDNNAPIITNETWHSIGPCTPAVNTPKSTGVYYATNECTDAFGWTHYINNVDGELGNDNDLLLLSIKKGTNDIGTIGDGNFDLFVEVGNNNNGDAIHIPSSVPYVNNENGWYVMDRYWNVTPTTQPSTPLEVKFYYTSDDYDDIANAPDVELPVHENLVFYKTIGNVDPNPANAHDGITSDDIQLFKEEGIQWVYTGPESNNYHTATFLEVASFSGGGGGASNCEGCGPLPVELISFTGKKQGKTSLLEWRTASEINNDYFTLERSLDGIHFNTLAKVQGQTNSLSQHDYRYEDVSPTKGVNYYRLLQTDLDGKVNRIDKIVAISFESNQGIHLYPIPASKHLFVELDLADYSTTAYRIYDALGQLTSRGYFDEVSDSQIYSIDISDLAKGVYYLSIGESGLSQGELFLKE